MRQNFFFNRIYAIRRCESKGQAHVEGKASLSDLDSPWRWQPPTFEAQPRPRREARGRRNTKVVGAPTWRLPGSRPCLSTPRGTRGPACTRLTEQHAERHARLSKERFIRSVKDNTILVKRMDALSWTSASRSLVWIPYLSASNSLSTASNMFSSRCAGRWRNFAIVEWVTPRRSSGRRRYAAAYQRVEILATDMDREGKNDD